MFAADRGRPQRSYPYNWLHCVLPAPLLPDKPVNATIRVFEHFREGEQLVLRLLVQNLQADDEVALMLNGQPVKSLRRDGAKRLTAKIGPGQLRFGANKAAIQLVERSAESAKPRTVTALELHAARPSN